MAATTVSSAMQRGLDCLQHQDWQAAESCFLEALAQQPFDERVGQFQLKCGNSISSRLTLFRASMIGDSTTRFTVPTTGTVAEGL